MLADATCEVRPDRRVPGRGVRQRSCRSPCEPTSAFPSCRGRRAGASSSKPAPSPKVIHPQWPKYLSRRLTIMVKAYSPRDRERIDMLAHVPANSGEAAVGRW